VENISKVNTDVAVARLKRIGLFNHVPRPSKPHAYQYELIGAMSSYIRLLSDRLRAEQALRRQKRK
jgi:hypothetical protein